MHIVGWFIWIVWWCTDQQTLNFKWTDIVLVFIDGFSFGRFFLFKIANNVSYLSSARNESISFIHTLSFSFPVFWQVLIQCSVTSFWANSHMWFKHTNIWETKPISIIRIEVWFNTPDDEHTVSETMVCLNHQKWLSAWSFTKSCYCESFTTCNCSVGLHTKDTGFHLYCPFVPRCNCVCGAV